MDTIFNEIDSCDDETPKGSFSARKLSAPQLLMAIDETSEVAPTAPNCTTNTEAGPPNSTCDDLLAQFFAPPSSIPEPTANLGLTESPSPLRCDADASTRNHHARLLDESRSVQTPPGPELLPGAADRMSGASRKQHRDERPGLDQPSPPPSKRKCIETDDYYPDFELVLEGQHGKCSSSDWPPTWKGILRLGDGDDQCALQQINDMLLRPDTSTVVFAGAGLSNLPNSSVCFSRCFILVVY